VLTNIYYTNVDDKQIYGKKESVKFTFRFRDDTYFWKEHMFWTRFDLLPTRFTFTDELKWMFVV